MALVLFQHGARLASSEREMVGTLLLSSALAEGDYGKQFPSVKDTQGVSLGLMAILCFSESEFLPRVILGVTLSSHSLLQWEDYHIIEVFMTTHRSERTGDKDDGGSMMLKHRTTVQLNCIFILC